MNRILVVDDEPAILRSVTVALTANDYQVEVAATGKQAVAKVAGSNFDAVILDLGLPDFSGLEVIRQVRDMAVDVPIIVLSALQEIETRVQALDLGADDYVPKPFGMPELLARLRVALRHARRGQEVALPPDDVLVRGALSIDTARRQVQVGGVAIELTRTQFDTLLYLAQHPDRVLTHGSITSAVWGPEAAVDPQNLRVVISQIRKRIEADTAAPRFIQTDLGVGYRFHAAQDPDAPPA